MIQKQPPSPPSPHLDNTIVLGVGSLLVDVDDIRDGDLRFYAAFPRQSPQFHPIPIRCRDKPQRRGYGTGYRLVEGYLVTVDQGKLGMIRCSQLIGWGNLLWFQAHGRNVSFQHERYPPYQRCCQPPQSIRRGMQLPRCNCS